ncbi:hypothetical protein D3C85_1318660 [compost metagenome]
MAGAEFQYTAQDPFQHDLFVRPVFSKVGPKGDLKKPEGKIPVVRSFGQFGNYLCPKRQWDIAFVVPQ